MLDGNGTSPLNAVQEDRPASLVDWQTLKAAVRRRRRFWIALALVGMVLGAGLHMVLPHKYSAVTDLYLVEPSGSDPSVAMGNDLSILKTTSVAGRALKSLGLKEPAGSLLAAYRGSELGPQVMSITLTERSPLEATQLAQAVAEAFLVRRVEVYDQQTAALVAGLQSQETNLQAKIQSIQAMVGSSGSKAVSLVSQQANDESQLTNISSQIAQDELSNTQITKGSFVIDPPTIVIKSAKKVTITDALTGLIAGLGLGLGIVLVGAVLSQAVRRRDEITAILGVPVKVSIRRFRLPLLMRGRRLHDLLSHPSPDQRRAQSCLSSELATSPAAALAVVSVEATDFAALCVAGLGLSLAAQGKQVAVVDLVPGGPLRSLLAGDQIVTPAEAPPAQTDSLIPPRGSLYYARGRNPHGMMANGWDMMDKRFGDVDPTPTKPGAIGSLRLIVGSDDPLAVPTDIAADVDVVLTLATLDPAVGGDQLTWWASDAVVFVTAGKASATRLTGVAAMLRGAGVTLRSSVLINPDPSDESVGMMDDDETLILDSGLQPSEQMLWLTPK